MYNEYIPNVYWGLLFFTLTHSIQKTFRKSDKVKTKKTSDSEISEANKIKKYPREVMSSR